jgi:hypothetical protein
VSNGRFREVIVERSYPYDACHHHRPWPLCRKFRNVVSSFVGGRVWRALASPLAPLVPHLIEGEGCACGPSGSCRNFGYGPPGVDASLVVWWRKAAGTGEAVMMALQWCDSLTICSWERGGRTMQRMWQ